jgi:hypothetical protein
MLGGMVYTLATPSISSTTLTSFGITNVPVTTQSTYVFTFILNPATANSPWYLRTSAGTISITAVGGPVYSGIALIGLGNGVIRILCNRLL